VVLRGPRRFFEAGNNLMWCASSMVSGGTSDGALTARGGWYPIRSWRRRMAKQHAVKQGECMASIARRHGFRDPRTLYDHADNADLRLRRPDPNVLFPGDSVVIPERDTRPERVETTAVHSFRVRLPRKVLRLRLVDADGRPRPGLSVELRVDGDARALTTDGDGAFEAPLPPGVSRLSLVVDGAEAELSPGHLDPPRDTPDRGLSGLRARLHNLGYATDTDAALREAISLFQRDEDLDVTGEADDATTHALLDRHGS